MRAEVGSTSFPDDAIYARSVELHEEGVGPFDARHLQSRLALVKDTDTGQQSETITVKDITADIDSIPLSRRNNFVLERMLQPEEVLPLIEVISDPNRSRDRVLERIAGKVIFEIGNGL